MADNKPNMAEATVSETEPHEPLHSLEAEETNLDGLPNGIQSMNQLIGNECERIEVLYNSGTFDFFMGIPTGFTDLDRMTSGLDAGELILISGLPSMGKTAFAANIGAYVAIKQALPVCFFSMDKNAESLSRRMISSVGYLDHHRLLTGNLQEEDWDKLTFAMGMLHNSHLYIDGTPALDIKELKTKARQLSLTCGQLGLIVIDNIQMIPSSSTGVKDAVNLTEITKELKALAEELRCAIIAVSQLEEAPGIEQRPDRRPTLSDLRFYGAIALYADTVLFVHRDEVLNPDTADKGTAEIIIRKNRNGATGTVKVPFHPESVCFENFEELNVCLENFEKLKTRRPRRRKKTSKKVESEATDDNQELFPPETLPATD